MSAATQQAQYRGNAAVYADNPMSQQEAAVRFQITQALLQLPSNEARNRVHQSLGFLIMADAVCPGIIEEYNQSSLNTQWRGANFGTTPGQNSS